MVEGIVWTYLRNGPIGRGNVRACFVDYFFRSLFSLGFSGIFGKNKINVLLILDNL
jgi:hypothetical protein